MRVFLIKSNIVISIIVSLLFLLLSGCANGLFYFPDQKDYGDTPKQYGQVYSEHYWQTEDGVKLHGWFIPAQRQGALDQKPLGTILFAHGNAGNITSHYWLVSWLPAAGVNLFIFDYRGFGQSEGIPTFKGTDLDTISAITYLKNKMGIESNKIMLLGQSLGGNSVIAAAAKMKDPAIKGLIIDGTFYNHQAIANYYFPGASLLVTGGYGASAYLSSLDKPLLFIHGTADLIVPFSHSEKLYQDANKPKELLLVPNVGHLLTLDRVAVQQEILRFMKQYLKE